MFGNVEVYNVIWKIMRKRKRERKKKEEKDIAKEKTIEKKLLLRQSGNAERTSILLKLSFVI